MPRDAFLLRLADMYAAVAQHLGERVSKRPWLKQLDDGSIGHGVSLLCWRSGGANTPTIRRLLPLSPSPPSAHSSVRTYLDLFTHAAEQSRKPYYLLHTRPGI